MNLSLFQSWWAAGGALIAGGFILWMHLIGASPGARTRPEEVTLLLWSGWVSLGLMVGVCLYSLRKYVHRLGISPEFRMKVPFAKLEEAERLMNDLRRRILMGQVGSLGEAAREATRILRECGVDRVCSAEVSAARRAGPKFVIRILNREPLGRMRKWLHFHAYLGLASGVTLWVHGGLLPPSILGIAMVALTAVVLLTGILGMLLFAVGPKWMTRAEKDMNFEDAFVLEQSLKKKIDAAYAGLKPDQVRVFRRAEKTGGTVAVQRTVLQEVVALEPAARKEMEDVMVLVAQRSRILQDLRGAARIRFLLNVWRVVHVPGSLLLLGIALIHVVSVIWY